MPRYSPKGATDTDVWLTIALASIALHVDELKEWDLRPSRLESLLKALAAFIVQHNPELARERR